MTIAAQTHEDGPRTLLASRGYRGIRPMAGTYHAAFWSALGPDGGRVVAKFSSTRIGEDPALQAARLRALAAAGLPVPAVVEDLPGGYVMARLPGLRPLSDLPRSPALALQVEALLRRLIASGEVHGDLTPGNVVRSAGRLWLIDPLATANPARLRDIDARDAAEVIDWCHGRPSFYG